jgi:hypothetical protein
MVSPLARRKQVAFARERGLSLRRACGLIGMSRSTPSYEPRLPAKDAPVIEAMKELSGQYPRYGYRRIRVFLRRRGFELSWSRTHRLWRQAGLLVPRKRPRKRIAAKRPRIHTPFKANMVWAYDFVFDTTATRLAKFGRKYWKAERPVNPLLILTGAELLTWEPVPRCWSAEQQRRFKNVNSLLEHCNASQQMYLGLPSWQQDWHTASERRRRAR